MEVEKTCTGPMETNIDPRLQKNELITEPIEYLIEVQVDPSKPNCVVKIGKGELAKQLTEFLC